MGEPGVDGMQEFACPHGHLLRFVDLGWEHADGSECDRLAEAEVADLVAVSLYEERCAERDKWAREYARLRIELDAMTAARDLCKRQATEAGERYVAAVADLDRYRELVEKLAEGLRRVCEEPCPHPGSMVPMCPWCAADAQAVLAEARGLLGEDGNT